MESNMDRRDFLKVGAYSLAALLGFGEESEAAAPVSYCRRGRPNELRGTGRSLRKQQDMMLADDLSILTERNLENFIDSDLLVRLPRSARTYFLDDGVKSKYSIVRPWSKLFLERISGQYHDKFKKRLKVGSASRTVEWQLEQRKKNRNATTPERSPHVRGSATDIIYAGMSRAENQWVRNVLVSLEKAGVLEATEECNQPVFHVMVFKDRYLSYVQQNMGISADQFAQYYKKVTGVNLLR